MGSHLTLGKLYHTARRCNPIQTESAGNHKQIIPDPQTIMGG